MGQIQRIPGAESEKRDYIEPERGSAHGFAERPFFGGLVHATRWYARHRSCHGGVSCAIIRCDAIGELAQVSGTLANEQQGEDCANCAQAGHQPPSRAPVSVEYANYFVERSRRDKTSQRSARVHEGDRESLVLAEPAI